MDPTDSFNPPLGGLGQGKKMHQLLTTINDSDLVIDADYRGKDHEGEGIMGLIPVGQLVDNKKAEGVGALLFANWWHQRLEVDWWEYTYAEVKMSDLLEILEDAEDGENGTADVIHYCTWSRQVNDDVDGHTYVSRTVDDGLETEPFDPKFDSPKPLTRAMLDTHIPEEIKSRYD